MRQTLIIHGLYMGLTFYSQINPKQSRNRESAGWFWELQTSAAMFVGLLGIAVRSTREMRQD